MSNINDKNDKKRPSDSNDKPPEKITKHVIFNLDNNIYNDDIDDIIINDEDKELIIIDREINTLIDLIELGKMYDSNKRYNIDLKILNNLVESLTELNNMIGMQAVKQDMIDHILFKIQNFDLSNQDMMHTVIQGPPGVGKTEVAKVIGKIYLAMGILTNNKFVKATRSQLIAAYLGQTSKATQKIIDSAIGGILFIDEVYSLGNPDKRDSYSKECIDTINENLTQNKNNFICIIAGYKNDIDSCFFAYNSGLERRFTVRFTIEPYNANELFLIFKKKVTDMEWSIDESINLTFFVENHKYFKFYGGDMETLFSKCKRAHSRRVFASKDPNKKILNNTDLKRGFELFKSHGQFKDIEKNSMWNDLYI